MAEDPSKMPSVPAAQNLQIPAQPTLPTFEMPYAPVNLDQYMQFQQEMFDQQLAQMRPLYSAISELTSDYGPEMARNRLEIEQEYGPQMAEYLMGQVNIAAPEFMQTYSQLGKMVQEGMSAGYELGPALSKEVEQSIRGAQTARGNWLGAAPTAQEAFGTGSAAIALYNQRLAQAQTFLNSKQPTDLWGALGMASAYQPMAATFPSSGYPNASLSADVFGTFAQSQASYNATSANAYGSYIGGLSSTYGTYVQGLVGAAGVNNQSAFDRYSAQFDQFLYGQSMNAGIMSQPSVGGGGSSWMGSAIGGIGTGVATGIGAAAMGASAAGAVGAGVGAAAGAAVAAICWVARRAMPDRWREWRRWLFTKAPGWFRTKYVYGGRRLAERLTEDQLPRVREIMCQAIIFTERGAV